MLYDQLRESWAFKEIWDEGKEKGHQEGLQEGLQKGHQQGLQEGLQEGLQRGIQQGEIAALRKTVLALVEKRFPQLLRMAQGMVSMTSELAVLEQMMLGIGVAQTAEEALTVLLGNSEDGKH